MKYIIIILLISMNSASAITYSNGSVSDSPIFKCQPTTIYANFSVYSGITSVYTQLSNKPPRPMIYGVQQYGVEELLMTNAGTGHYYLNYANDPDTINGNKNIVFKVYDGASNTTISTSLELIVAPDTCVGTVTNYTQISSGLGRYTNMLYTDPNINLGTWVLYPYVEMFGFAFYVIIILVVTGVIYIGSRTITTPAVAALFLLLGFASAVTLPTSWILYVLFVFMIAFAVIAYRLSVRE